MDLHPGCKARLVELIAAKLPEIRVRNNIFINFESTLGLLEADNVLPTTGSARKNLVQYIDDSPVFSFIVDHLSRRIDNECSYDSNVAEKFLTELPGYDGTVKIATQLIDALCSLPWNYTYSLELNGSLANKLRQAPLRDEPGQTLPLNHSIRLVRPDDEYAATYPLLSEEEERADNPFTSVFLGKDLPFEWRYEGLYLIIDNTGYVPRWGASTPLDNAIANVKAFIGLGLAVRLFDPRRDLALAHALGGINKKKIVVHRQENASWHYDRNAELSSEATELLDRLDITQINENAMAAFIRDRLELVKIAFSHLEQTHKIRLSSEWLFDSYSTKAICLRLCKLLWLLKFCSVTRHNQTLWGSENF